MGCAEQEAQRSLAVVGTCARGLGQRLRDGPVRQTTEMESMAWF